MTDISQTGPVSGGRIPQWNVASRQDRASELGSSHSQTASAARADSVELSSLALDSEDTEIRTDLVNHVRELIARGEYITEQRIDATVSALIDQFA